MTLETHSNFKTYSKSYKMKKRLVNPEENWAVFKNVHEPVIDRATWEKVQNLKAGTRRKRSKITQESSVFSGVLKCPECGGNLNFHFNQGNHDIKYFNCSNYNTGLRKCTCTHYIRVDFLEQVLLQEIHRLTRFASCYEDDFLKIIVGRSAAAAADEQARKKRELQSLIARDKELDTLFERMYEDNVSGKIDDARFMKMSKRYEDEQQEITEKIKTLRKAMKDTDVEQMDVQRFLDAIRRYTDATQITRRMVAELIDHIDVYHQERKNGIATQRLTIFYNCIGAFSVPDCQDIPEPSVFMETRKGVALRYAPATAGV